jgi:hypothetical protein
MRPPSKRETAFWLCLGVLLASAALVVPRFAGAQQTGGSFGGSAWGTGGSSSSSARPPSRPSRPSSNNSAFGSGYDYNRNRNRQRPGARPSNGGCCCGSSGMISAVGLLAMAAVTSNRRNRKR